MRRYEDITTTDTFGQTLFAENMNLPTAMKMLNEFAINHGSKLWLESMKREVNRHLLSVHIEDTQQHWHGLIKPIEAKIPSDTYSQDQIWEEFVAAIQIAKKYVTELIHGNQHHWAVTSCDFKKPQQCFLAGVQVLEHYEKWLKYRYENFDKLMRDELGDIDLTALQEAHKGNLEQLKEHFDSTVQSYLIEQSSTSDIESDSEHVPGSRRSSFGQSRAVGLISTALSSLAIVAGSVTGNKHAIPSNLKNKILESDMKLFVNEISHGLRLIAFYCDRSMQQTISIYEYWMPWGVFALLPDYVPVEQNDLQSIKAGQLEYDALKAVILPWVEQFETAFKTSESYALRCGRLCIVASSDYLDEVKQVLQKVEIWKEDGSFDYNWIATRIEKLGPIYMEKAYKTHFTILHAGTHSLHHVEGPPTAV